MNTDAPVDTRENYSANPAVGTEAYDIFHGKVDFDGSVIQHHESDPGWWMDIEFKNLDPSGYYSFVGTAFRTTTDTDRISLFTISDAISYVNNSGYPPDHPEWVGIDATKFLAVDNHIQGLVVRWDEIQPGGDGEFKIRAEADKNPGSHGRRAYPFHGFMLQRGMSNPNVRTDVRSDMFNVNSSLWMRMEFDLTDDPATIENLTLRMKYEDGLVIYLNGIEVERQNFFPDPCMPHWNSQSLSNRPDALAYTFEEFDISDHIDDLQLGYNVLAIHGLNYDADDPNFLILPELIAEIVPSANTYTVLTPVSISADTGEKPQSKIWRNQDGLWWARENKGVSFRFRSFEFRICKYDAWQRFL